MWLRLTLPVLFLTFFASPPLQAQEILKGYVTKEDLSDQSPLFDIYIDRYTPDPDIVEDLSGITADLHLRVYMATWCKESIRYIPELFRVVKDAGNPQLSTTFIALGYPREDITGTISDHAIESIPTIIVESEGKEIGRITEKPEISIEADLRQILKSHYKMH